MNSSSGSIALLFGVLCLPVRATSQQQQPADTARRDTSAATLPAVQVRATIAPTAGSTIRSGIPARISSVTSREIETWKPRTVAQALASQPGVSTHDDLGASYKLNVVTRGFNASPTVGLPPGVTVFLDGVRQNEADAQEVNFDLLPLEHVERIELLSGSASLLGPNSLGGAVNLVTRHGSDRPSGEVEAEAASFGGYSTRAALSAYSPVGTGRGFGIIYFRRSRAERLNVNQSPDASVRSFTMNYSMGSSVDWRRSLSLGPGSLALRAGLDGSTDRRIGESRSRSHLFRAAR